MSTPNKYQPPVNIPENIPTVENPAVQPATILVQFLSTDGHWMGFNSQELVLAQKNDNTASICAHVGDKLIHLLNYPGVKLTAIALEPIAEKTIVVP